MNEISKSLMCVQMRSGVEVWVEAERAEALQDVLGKISGSKFIRFDEQTLNTADIVGVFRASTMADVTRRKNGQWQCHRGTWHDKGEDCPCLTKDAEEQVRRRHEAVKACGKCEGGWVRGNDTAAICPCIANLK